MNKIISTLFIIFMMVFLIGYENTSAQSSYSADINTVLIDAAIPYVNIQVADAGRLASGENSSARKSTARRIRFIFDGGEATGILYNNLAADSLFAQLPVTVTFSDFGRQEKIAYFPRKFTLEGAPRGSDNQAGDICIYAPWGNLAVYYVDTEYSTSLIPLGRIESGLEQMAAEKSDFKVTVEVVK